MIEKFVTVVNTLLFILGCIVEIGTLLLVTQGPMLQEVSISASQIVSFAVGWMMIFAGIFGCRVVRTRQKKCIIAYIMIIILTLIAEAYVSIQFMQFADVLSEANELQSNRDSGNKIKISSTVRKPLEKFHSGFVKQYQNFGCMLVKGNKGPDDESPGSLKDRRLAQRADLFSPVGIQHARRLGGDSPNPQCSRKLAKLYNDNKSTGLIHCWRKEELGTNVDTDQEGQNNHHAEFFEKTVNRACTSKWLDDGVKEYQGKTQKDIIKDFEQGCQHCTRNYADWITKDGKTAPEGWKDAGKYEVNHVFCRCFARLLDSVSRHTKMFFICAGIFAGVEFLLLISMIVFYFRNKDQFHDVRVSYLVEEEEEGIEITQRPANW